MPLSQRGLCQIGGNFLHPLLIEEGGFKSDLLVLCADMEVLKSICHVLHDSSSCAFVVLYESSLFVSFDLLSSATLRLFRDSDIFQLVCQPLHIDFYVANIDLQAG